VLAAQSKSQALEKSIMSRIPRDSGQAGSLALRSIWRTVNAARGILLAALLLSLPSGAQYSPAITQLQQIPPRQMGGMPDDAPQTDPIQDEKRLNALNAQRHKSLVSDTDKLLRLAQELNDEVGSPGTGAVTSSEYNKVGEIEKLAHRIKDKMGTSVRAIPESQPFGPLSPRY